MKKSSGLLASLLMPLAIAAVAAPSCAGGETAPGGTGATSGTGAGTGSGGRVGSSSGGASSFGSGGASSFGSGGASTSSGGASSFGSGGAGTGSGGSSFGSSGGASGSGGVIIGGGTGGGPVAGGPLTVTGGYATNGTWKGYAYPFAGPPTGSTGTVTPATFMTSTQLCAMGTLAPDLTFNSTVGIGWSVAQDMAATAASPPKGAIATTGVGLFINVGSVTGLALAVGGGSQLRVQITNATGMINWCAPLAASGPAMIPWGSFNTTCYNTTLPAASAYTVGTPISAVGLVVPSTAAATIGPFNFCLVDAHPY